MTTRKLLVILTASLIGVNAIEPVFAQGFNPPYGGRGNDQYSRGNQGDSNEAYRQGYRAGYDDGRTRRPYDDTDYTYGSGYDSSFRTDDRSQRWQRRYGRIYSYNDDNFYQECQQTAAPAGGIAGAVIGGLLGNAAGGGRAGATVTGVIVGGVLGATLSRNLDCEDRSYAYKSYYDGLSAGRPNAMYQWRNPRGGHYGDFRVGDYFNDPDGFRCANYTQRTYINNRPQTTTGRACQQPDGIWTMIN